MIGMSDKKTARPYFRKYFSRSLTSLFHVWSLNRNLTSNPSSSLTLKMTCFPPMRFSGSERKTKVGWLVIVAFSKQTLWRPCKSCRWWGKKKNRLYLSLALTLVKGKCPVFPEGPLSAPGCCVQVSETRWPFSVRLNPCANPSPWGVHEHLFSKMKAQAETRAVLQNSLFLDFFFF